MLAPLVRSINPGTIPVIALLRIIIIFSSIEFKGGEIVLNLNRKLKSAGVVYWRLAQAVRYCKTPAVKVIESVLLVEEGWVVMKLITGSVYIPAFYSFCRIVL